MDFDLPFIDPARTHASGMEGWYWRIVLPEGQVLIALTGVVQPARSTRRVFLSSWALVALAAHPGGHVAHTLVDGARGAAHGYGADCGPALQADAQSLCVRIGAERLDASFHEPRIWPRRLWGALGPAHAVPRLPQHWHPHVLRARVSGSATIAGREIRLDGGLAYAEKNWGPAFATDWWWGQAFLGSETTVAFAGGRLRVGAPTAIVVSHGASLLRLSPPLARVTTALAPGAWRLRGSTPRHTVEIEGEALGEPHVLPVPVRHERRVEMRSRQHLAARMRVLVRRGSRTLLDEDTTLAGLELGLNDPPPGAPPA